MDELPKPLLLSDEEVARIHGWVKQFLPASYDRAFIADTIILNAWMKEIPHVSREYVRNKCISAWRSLKRERRGNEEATRSGSVRTTNMVTSQTGVGGDNLETSEHAEVERKILIEEATGKLSPFERRLIWMKYYDGQTLDEIAANVTLRRDQVQAALKVAIYKMRVHLT